MEILAVLALIALLLFLGYLWGRPSSDSDISLKLTAEPGAPGPKIVCPPSRNPDHPLLPEQFVVLDLETTGLDPYLDEIIEFGAIRVNRVLGTQTAFRMLVRSERQLPELIKSITGITQAMVDRDGRPLAEALTDFMEFIGELPLVAYNAVFDIGFLQQAATRQGHPLKNKYACALKMARSAWPGLPSYKLVDLAKRRNLPDDDTHRALGDSKRALVIFMSAVEEVRKVSWTTPSLDFVVE
jgi:DNA polymerase III epsilon subunit family exonuclease